MNQEQLLQIAKNVPGILWMTDMARTRLFYVSPAYEKIWGRTCRSLYEDPKPFLDALHPEDRARGIINFEEEEFDKEFRIVRPDGSVRWIWARGFPIRDEGGRPNRMAGISVDITERKSMEEKIHQQKDLLRSAIESLPHPFYIIDADDYKIKMANTAASAHNSAEDITCYALTHHRDIPCESTEHPCPLGEVKKTKQPAVMEHIHHDRDGRLKFVEVLGSPVFDTEGNVMQMVVYALDITEKKKFLNNLKFEKERAKKADQLKSIFLANMSHEIRTPLNSIIGFIDLVLSGVELSRENRHYLQNSKESANILLFLINDILDLSKIEAGQLQIEEIPCSLDYILNRAGSIAGVLLSGKEKNVSLRQSRPANVSCYILSDPFRLEQIMDNLISNAVKFTEQGFIEYGVFLKDKNILEFYVRDTGIGISEEMQSKIFEPFQQGKTDTLRKYGGTGLGLAVIKKLIELMGGKINVESKQGDGSSFYFTLPYKPTKAPEPPASLKVEEVRNKKSKTTNTILVAEDDPINRLLVQRILQKQGYTVVIAGDGKDAVSIYKTDSSINMILMDMQMPYLGGLEATRVIRRIEKTEGKKRIPIIALTAAAMKGDDDRGFEAGCDAYVTKPLDKDRLVTEIRKYIG